MPSNVYNASWFASNLVRKYPLDSNASCIDDGGDYLPDDIITDINISYPRSLGDYCYISAVNITEKLISIVISCGETTIAACCVARPVDIDRYYVLDSLYDGVTGVIALNLDCTDCVGSWTFSDGKDSRILPSCCTVYDPPSVLSLSRIDDADPLTGDILLTHGNDIELSVKDLVLDGKPVKAIFIGLPLEAEVLKKYITPCEIVTEADTCGRKYTAMLGSAEPECDGNIEIVSRTDTIHINQLTDGVLTLSTNYTVDDLCPKRNYKFDDYLNDESDSSGGGGGSGDKSDSYCGYGSPVSPNICEPQQTREISPLITRSKKLDLSLKYVNLYTSDIQIVSGGAVYGDGIGLINAGDEDLTIKTVINNVNKVDIQLKLIKKDNPTALITTGDATISVMKGYIYIDSYTTEVEMVDSSSYHIVITADYIAVEDSDYNILYKDERKHTLSDDIFVTINGIKCETIAYE